MVDGNEIDQISTVFSNLLKYTNIIYKVKKLFFLTFNARPIFI